MVQKALTVADFNSILDDYAGRVIVHTPISVSTSNITGETTLTDGTTASIKAYAMNYNEKFDYVKAGFVQKGDMVALTKYADSVKKDDKLSVDNKVYRVKEAFNVPGVFSSTVASDTILVYTSCNLFLLEDE